MELVLKFVAYKPETAGPSERHVSGPIDSVMYHESSNDIGSQSPLPSIGSDGDGVVANPSAVFRIQHLALRGQVMSELGKCHEECDKMPTLIQGVRLMSDLNSQFTFQDALAFYPSSSHDAADRAVNALKANISAAVQSVASQADDLCKTPEAREEFSQRLERQFEEIRARLILDATQSVERNLQAVCTRVEGIVQHLRSFGSPLAPNCERFDMFARALRSYIDNGLEQLTVRGHLPGELGQTELSVREFFTQLDTLVVDTLEALRVQAAA